LSQPCDRAVRPQWATCLGPLVRGSVQPSSDRPRNPQTPKSSSMSMPSFARARRLERRHVRASRAQDTHAIASAIVMPTSRPARRARSSPTGSGKTSLRHPIVDPDRGAARRALILAPTRELASQIVERASIAHAPPLKVAPTMAAQHRAPAQRGLGRSHPGRDSGAWRTFSPATR